MPVASSRRGVSFSVLAALAVAYWAMPAHREGLVAGLPLGPVGTAIVAATVVLGLVFRRVRFEQRRFAAFGVLTALLLVARVGLGLLSVPSGWSARYFANERWEGTPEWSSDFRRLEATRVDRRIVFRDDTFPAHYLNDVSFDRGDRREVTEPMSVEWRGFTTAGASRTIRAALIARGAATLAVDGRIAVSATGPKAPGTAEASIALGPGVHELVVRYLKPSDTDGLIDVRVETDASDASGAPVAFEVTPDGRDPRRSDRLLPVARAVDALMLLVFAGAATWAARLSWRQRGDSRAPWMTLALCTLFGAQGWRQALPFAGRIRPLTFGDDWWGFESCARDVLHHGPLMTLGKAIGQGEPYFYHPLYSYFLAAVHAVSGESLFGPVFVQFLILAAVSATMWRCAASLFGEVPALAGLAALVVVFELDFARYYTVTLLSENLYILTVTLTLVPFVRWVREGGRGDLLRMGFWGGVSTLTRPPMLFDLAPALVLVAIVSAVRAGRIAAAARPVAIAATVWLATMAPATVRNIVVAHRFVLVSEVQRSSVVTYNLPASVDPAAYDQRVGGTFASALGTLARVARDHPRAFMSLEATKIGFSLGMIQWAGGYRPHPELIAVTALYLAMCVASARMRSRLLWPVHLFVLVHLASMLLTMPWNYGYRLILPPFVYTATLSTAAFAAWVASWRLGAAGPAPAEARA